MAFRVKHLAVLALPILATLVFLTTWSDPFNEPKLIVIAAMLPFAIWGTMNSIGQIQISSFRIELSIFVAIVLSIILVSVFSPQSVLEKWMGEPGRNNGILAFVTCITLALLAIILTTLSKTFQKEVQFAIFITSVPFVVYSWIQYFGLDFVKWSNLSNPVIGTVGNTNFSSAFLALGSINAILLSISANKSIAKILFIIFATSNIWLSLETKSSQGPFSIGFATFLIVASILVNKYRKLAIPIFILLVSLVVSVAMGIFGLGPLSDYLRENSVIVRTYYWKAAIEMMWANPFTGVGPDNYGDFFRSYRDSALIPYTTIDLTTNNAHNSLLQIGATYGAFVFSIFVLLMLYAAYLALKRIFGVADLQEKSLSIIFLQLLLISLISIDNLAIAPWLYVLWGSQLSIWKKIDKDLDGIEDNKKRKETRHYATVYTRQDKTKYLTFFSSIMIFTLMWSAGEVSRNTNKLLSKPVQTSDAIFMDNYSNEIVKQCSKFGFNTMHMSMLLPRLVELKRDIEINELLECAYEKYPRDFNVVNNLAYSLENQGLIAKALKLRLEQLKMDPNRGLTPLLIAINYYNLGDNDSAQRYLLISKINLANLDEVGKDKLFQLEKLLGKS